ncbi:MAG TPA: hypothetical protein VKV26_25505 [Dehalococcoidia bacterium]|nr:hypothetical protein [Dehalococcoidia bacterium]
MKHSSASPCLGRQLCRGSHRRDHSTSTARARLRDLTIEEPEIEDIVRRIYSGDTAEATSIWQTLRSG